MGDCNFYINCENTSEGWESLFKRLIVEMDDGTLALRTCCATVTPEPPPVDLALELTWDDIANVPMGGDDAAVLEEWNSFFDLPTNGTPFSSVVVDGDVVKLYGGSGITLTNGEDGSCNRGNPQLFEGNLHLISIVDDADCVVGADNCCFAECSAATTFDLPALETAGDRCFISCSSATTFDLPSLTTAGDGCFSSCSSATTFDLPSLTTAGSRCFGDCTAATTFDLPSLTTAGDNCFFNCTAATTFDLSSCTDLGGTTGDDEVFIDIAGQTITLTCPAALLTCNGGAPDGDLCVLHANNTLTVNGGALTGCP